MLKWLEEKKARERATNEVAAPHPETAAPSAATLLDAANALAALHNKNSPRVQATSVMPAGSESRASSFSAASDAVPPSKGKKAQKKQATLCIDRNASFPERLMAVLSDPDASNCVCWLPDGLSFAITSPQKLTLEVLPRHFGQTEFASFTRKLYWWGFKKGSRSRAASAVSASSSAAAAAGAADSFHHEMFRRDMPELCAKMRGTPVKRKRKAAAKASAITAVAVPSAQQQAATAVVGAGANPRHTASPQATPSMRSASEVPSCAVAPSLERIRAAAVTVSPTAAKHLPPSGTATATATALQLKSAAYVSSLLESMKKQKRDQATLASALASASSNLTQSNSVSSGNTTLPTVAALPVQYAQLLARLQQQGNNAAPSVSAQAFYTNALQQVRAQQQQAAHRERQKQAVAAAAVAQVQAAQALQQRVQRVQVQRQQQQHQRQQGQSQQQVVIHVHHHHMVGGRSYTTVSRNPSA